MRLAVILAVLLCAAGCEDMKRDPPPIAEVEVAVDGSYRLEGRSFSQERLDAELSRRAADAPNEKLGRTRLQVRIRQIPGASYERVMDLRERCQSLGISNVEVMR